ncbi:MAG TPA: hypothetical protein VI703_08605 [Anaerolineales bacterium]|nr:hypothetical protein [Anaerolineales bacterium]
MVARIGAWIELSFWRVGVHVLSGARPFSHTLQKIHKFVVTRPIFHFFAKTWIIASSGWVLGLFLGIVIAFWI